MRFAAAALCVIACWPSGAMAATTLARTDEGPVEPWQGWIATSLAPTPGGTITFANAYCPPAGWSACYEPATRTIYMAGPNASNRAQFFHELGHDFDATVLTDAYRAGFIKIMRYRTSSWAAHAPGSDESAEERFASAYSVCARRRQISQRGHFYGPGHGYGYRPTASQHRRVCALIRRAAF